MIYETMSHNSLVFDQLFCAPTYKLVGETSPPTVLSLFIKFECHNRPDKKSENFYYIQHTEQKRERRYGVVLRLKDSPNLLRLYIAFM